MTNHSNHAVKPTVTYAGLRADMFQPFDGLMRETTTTAGSLILAYYSGGGHWVDSPDLIRFHYQTGADDIPKTEAMRVVRLLDQKWGTRP